MSALHKICYKTNKRNGAKPLALLFGALLLCSFSSGYAASEEIQLDAKQEKFLAIFTTSDATPAQAVILLPDTGLPANEPGVIEPLRQAFDTLKVPTLTISNAPATNAERLKSAIAYLQTKQVKRIVLVGHGQGGDAMWQYALNAPESEIRAVVLLSAHPTVIEEKQLAALKNSRLHLLDIQAENDFDIAKKAVATRELLSNSLTQQQYRRVTMPGASYYYPLQSPSLAKIIYGWMKKSAYMPRDLDIRS